MKIQGLIPLEIMSKPKDIPTRYDLGIQFEVVINNTQAIPTKVQYLGDDSLAWSTDGSKLNVGVGVEVKGSRFMLSNSIFY